MSMMLLASIGLGVAFYLRERQIASVVALRGGASVGTLRRRERYKGSRKSEAARRRLRDASRFVSGLVRRPSGWAWARPPFPYPGVFR